MFQVGVQIALSKTSLTKIITFTPYFMIQNTVSEFEVSVYEVENPGQLTKVAAGETEPFWPVHGATKVRIKVSDQGQVSETEPFSIKEAKSTLLMLNNKYGGLHAEVMFFHMR